MILPDLREAQRGSAGGKAATLGRLLRAGLPVPPGVVIPVGEHRRHLDRHGILPGRAAPSELREQILRSSLSEELVQAIDEALRGLEQVGGPVDTGSYAVRSSATTEDTVRESAAGQHDSVLGVRGTEAVSRAVLRCWASLFSDRADAYRQGRAAAAGAPPPGAPEMAVIVQRLVDADVSGVLFTGEGALLEAAPGIGEQLVGGAITPDSWRLGGPGPDGRSILERHPGASASGGTRPRRGMCLGDAQVQAVDALGTEVSAVLGASADIEWALAGEQVVILQARPITAAVPGRRPTPERPRPPGDLTGTAASGGIATGPVRTVRGPRDFARVRPGDVLVCRTTDPAWTPLFRVAGAVVTEVGGVLSHAAIVARELGIPAVLAVPEAMTALADGSIATVDGDTGEVTAAADRTQDP